MPTSLCSALAILLLSSAALSADTTCAVNACLKAVKANYYLHNAPKYAPHECRRYLDVTVTPEPTTVTLTHTKTQDTTVVSTRDASSIAFTTEIVSVTATLSLTTTAASPPATTVVVKRNGGSCPAPSAANPTYPAYASACTDGAAFSSACSCVGVTTGSTKTLPACTSTVHVVVTHTSTASTVATSLTVSTSTVLVTTTDSTLTSSITIAAAMTTAYTFSPICYSVTVDSIPYSIYYSGASYSEDTDNPGNDMSDRPPITNALSGGFTPCEAAQQCADLSINDESQYWSFDLHFLASTGEWQCVQYFDPNYDPSYFGTYNQDVVQAYGFNIV